MAKKQSSAKAASEQTVSKTDKATITKATTKVTNAKPTKASKKKSTQQPKTNGVTTKDNKPKHANQQKQIVVATTSNDTKKKKKSKKKKKKKRKTPPTDAQADETADDDTTTTTLTKTKSSAAANAPMTEVHRCRFVDWAPDAVHVMSANADGTMLAVGRAGSAIELWDLRDGWHQIGVIPDDAESSATSEDGNSSEAARYKLRALTWIGDRLFGASLDGHVFEVSCDRMDRSRSIDTYGGAAWSLATTCDEATMCVGCEDGRLRFIDVADGDFAVRRTSSGAASGRVLCLSAHPDDADAMFSAGVDGTIRRWSVATGRVTLQMDVHRFGSDDQTLVWALQSLPDGTLVSGDSRGHVSFWDTTTGTMVQSFQEHTADVFALAASSDGSKVFASGADSRVAMFQATGATEGRQWAYSYSYRPHTHDVRALVRVTCKSLTDDSTIEAVVSGGDDTQMCWYSMSKFGSGRPTKVAPFRQHAIAAVAQPWSDSNSTTTGDVSANQDDRVLLVRHERSLELFRLHSSTSAPHTTRGEHTTVHHFAGSFGLRCAALSPDARWVACGHAGGLSLVSLDDSLGCAAQWRVCTDAADGVPVEMAFTRDMPSSRLIVATQSGNVHVYELPTPDEEGEEDAGATKVLGEPLDSFMVDGPVQILVTDPEAKWVAAGARNGDVYVHKLSSAAAETATRKNKGAAKKQQSVGGGYRVPNALFGGKSHVSLAFHPAEPAVLVVLSTDNRFYFYDVKDQKVSDWSVQHTARIPDQLVHASARAIGMAFDPAQPRKLILWSSAFVFRVDLDVVAARALDIVDAGDSSVAVEGRKAKKARRKDGKDGVVMAAKKKTGTSSSGASGVRISKDYGPIVFLDYTGAGQALVLEANWLKVMSHFPNVLQRQRYGTN